MQHVDNAGNVHVGIGRSTLRNASEAGREAAVRAVESLGGQRPALVIVFTTPRYDLAALIASIRSVTRPARLIGSTSSGEMVQGDYMGFGAGVAVLALTAGPYGFGLASAPCRPGELDCIGQEMARQSRAEAGPGTSSTFLLFADPLHGDLQQLICGIYRVTGPQVPIIGGASADEQKFITTHVFHDDQIIEGGAVGLWINSDRPLPVVTRHGWQPMGVPLLVTRAEGTVIMEFGGRPAAEVYEEQLGIAPGQLSAEAFWGTSILHPFGLLQPDGSFVIRVARAKTEDGGLRIQGCVPPPGAAVQVMRGSADTLLGIVGEVVDAALAAYPRASALLAFSCAARATIFKERVGEEARRLQEAAGTVPTFGIYCCGEFARTVGVLGTHNATFSVLAL